MVLTAIKKILKENKSISVGDTVPTRLMAAINLSPESFYKESYCSPFDKNKLITKFDQVISEGCDFIDLGPKSTAPVEIYGMETKISPKEEINRLKLPLQVLHDNFSDILVSVDTQSSEVADFALSHGADIINDISWLKRDKDMASIISNHNAGVIVMACRKNPGDIYKVDDVVRELSVSKSMAIDVGISEDQIIIDPGIGGWIPERIPEHDFRLIIEVPIIKEKLKLPTLIALSRKSFIGKTLNVDPSKRLAGSLSATAISVFYGADIIRTHDIIDTKHAILIAENLKKLI
jgi:dihydropteroate synthase